MEEEVVTLDEVVRENISEEVTFKQIPENEIGRKWATKERVLGRRSSWCKGPEARGHMGCPAGQRD